MNIKIIPSHFCEQHIDESWWTILGEPNNTFKIYIFCYSHKYNKN